MSLGLMNSRTSFVAEAVRGLRVSGADLVRVHGDPLFVTRAVPAQDKVAVVSGGGSGHEPLHTGFVGPGMLDAAVPGEVFSSPTAAQIRAAIRDVDSGRGTLVIVKNYTGDVLNFSVAAELLGEDHPTELVIVDDDLATASMVQGGPGRRGTAAVIAVEKICGAAAEEGAPLRDLGELGRSVVMASATLGLAFRSCTHPGTHRRSFELDDGQIEFGVGIHGERGIETRPLADAMALVSDLVRPLVSETGLCRGDEVIAIVNGLGSTTGLELGVAANELETFLSSGGIGVARALVGSFVTSLDMHGLSITLVKANDEFLRLWDAPVRTPALAW
jgi:phosphoenolpyruvate---glycerone phosphotransferase subunit DhaK